jgi:hypothetical protein
MKETELMPQSPSIPPESTRQHWQFSIRGMLIFTASVAIGFSAMQINKNCWFGCSGVSRRSDDYSIIKTDWCGGLIVTLLFWMGLGLLYQIRDLRRCLASHSELDREQTVGGKFEIAWRIAILAIFGLCAVNAILMDRGLYALREEINLLYAPGPMIREGILSFLAVMLVGNIPCVYRETGRSFLQRFLNPAACALAAGLCLVQWMNMTWFECEVHFSYLEYNNAFPNIYSLIDAKSYPSRIWLFFWWSVAAGLTVILNAALLNRLAKQWSRGVGRRLLCLGFLSVGIAFVSSYAIWILTRGLREISPYLAEAGNTSSKYSWFAAVAFLAVFVTALAYRLTAERRPLSDDRQISWRANPDKYFDEWRSILLLFAMALIASYFYDLYRTLYELGFFRRSLASSLQPPIMRQLTILVLFTPPHALWLAVIMLAIHRTFCRRPNPNHCQVDLPCINFAKFITIWLATAAFAVSGTLTLVWMSFGLWFNPWFNR